MSHVIPTLEAATGAEADGSIAVGGLTPLTTVDFPGRLAAVVFCQGCPWRCPYCHNPHLLRRHPRAAAKWPEVLAFLRSRAGLLDGVAFSGGEPLLQPGLGRAMADVRLMGFQIALHTAGSGPGNLSRVLRLLQWVGFDVKAPFADYARITGVSGSGTAARESLGVLLDSGVSYEVRTTVDPTLLCSDAIRNLARDLVRLGVRRFVLQEYRPPANQPVAGPETALHDQALIEWLAEAFPSFEVRSVAGP